MRFPRYSTKSYRQPGTSVVDGYIDFYSKFETDNRTAIDALPVTNPRRISMRIGRGCLIAANGNGQAADKIFRRAQRDLQPVIDSPRRYTGVGHCALELDSTAHMLEVRGNAAAVAGTREMLHARTIDTIRGLRAYLGPENDQRLSRPAMTHANGELVHRVALGLFTRYGAHPWELALPSLVHHDQGRVPKYNFDMLLVETGPDQPTTDTHKIQIKNRCIELCADPMSDPIDRGAYASDISFISGCCDLEMRGPARDPQRFRVPDLLIKEADGEATTKEIRTLDILTDTVMLGLTMGDERRIGTAPLEPQLLQHQ
jgi:hypothetical protein